MTAASPTAPSAGADQVVVQIDDSRPGGPGPREVRVPAGATVRDALRESGYLAEGCIVLIDDLSVPLDAPLSSGTRLTVVRAFSGG